MNALVPLAELDGLLSSAFVAKSFTGAKFVKGFNHLGAATLAADPIVDGGHRVVFLSSDDEDAIAPVADLAKELGFAPVKLGKLNEGGALVHARGRTWGLAKGIYREYDSKQFVFSERHFSHVCRSFDAQMSEGEFRRAL
jgi:predicted dinucleotide-binding enzyme